MITKTVARFDPFSSSTVNRHSVDVTGVISLPAVYTSIAGTTVSIGPFRVIYEGMIIESNVAEPVTVQPEHKYICLVNIDSSLTTTPSLLATVEPTGLPICRRQQNGWASMPRVEFDRGTDIGFTRSMVSADEIELKTVLYGEFEGAVSRVVSDDRTYGLQATPEGFEIDVINRDGEYIPAVGVEHDAIVAIPGLTVRADNLGAFVYAVDESTGAQYATAFAGGIRTMAIAPSPVPGELARLAIVTLAGVVQYHSVDSLFNISLISSHSPSGNISVIRMPKWDRIVYKNGASVVTVVDIPDGFSFRIAASYSSSWFDCEGNDVVCRDGVGGVTKNGIQFIDSTAGLTAVFPIILNGRVYLWSAGGGFTGLILPGGIKWEIPYDSTPFDLQKWIGKNGIANILMRLISPAGQEDSVFLQINLNTQEVIANQRIDTVSGNISGFTMVDESMLGRFYINTTQINGYNNSAVPDNSIASFSYGHLSATPMKANAIKYNKDAPKFISYGSKYRKKMINLQPADEADNILVMGNSVVDGNDVLVNDIHIGAPSPAVPTISATHVHSGSLWTIYETSDYHFMVSDGDVVYLNAAPSVMHPCFAIDKGFGVRGTLAAPPDQWLAGGIEIRDVNAINMYLDAAYKTVIWNANIQNLFIEHCREVVVINSYVGTITDADPANNTIVFLGCTGAVPSPGSGGAFENTGTMVRQLTGASYSENFVFGSPQLDDDGVAGHFNRMIFDKAAGYFAAGGTDGNEWDSVNRGMFSYNFGWRNLVTGQGSCAVGDGHTITGNSSSAFGHTHTNYASRTALFGNGCTANGLTRSSMAAGDNLTLNRCGNSLVVGSSNTLDNAFNSIVGGGGNTVRGTGNIVGGNGNVVVLTNSIIGGQNNSSPGVLGVPDSVLVVGDGNTVLERLNAIFGSQNTVGPLGSYHNLVSGEDHTIVGRGNAIFGSGHEMTAGDNNFISGSTNEISSHGGDNNIITGSSNEMGASTNQCGILGGNNNYTYFSTGSSIIGGASNQLNADYSTILGGSFNDIDGVDSAVTMGYYGQAHNKAGFTRGGGTHKKFMSDGSGGEINAGPGSAQVEQLVAVCRTTNSITNKPFTFDNSFAEVMTLPKIDNMVYLDATVMGTFDVSTPNVGNSGTAIYRAQAIARRLASGLVDILWDQTDTIFDMGGAFSIGLRPRWQEIPLSVTGQVALYVRGADAAINWTADIRVISTASNLI